jgi:mono/diheme cytochrome c family protein
MCRADASTYLALPLVSAVSVLAGTGCDYVYNNMGDQPRYQPQHRSAFFADRRSDRHPPEDTVARGFLRLDDRFYQGKENGKDIADIPLPVDEGLIRQGRDAYELYCAMCHDRMGTGNGMIVQRGYKRPPSYHEQRLRDAPAGHFYDVITNGWGAMASYAFMVPPRERWAIVAYIRALQLSRAATAADLTADERARLDEATAAAPADPTQRPGMSRTEAPR